MHTESVTEVYDLVRTRLVPAYAAFLQCRNRRDLHALPLYRELEPTIRAVLDCVDSGDFRTREAPAKPAYRVVAWNIERGCEFAGQLDALRHHPYLRHADVLLITEADVGMARSGNRAVVQEFARELGMAFAFAPCYLSLVKGSGVEYFTDGENKLGLHGNAILSRYPLRNVRSIRLRNGRDKMAGREKRLGSQAAVAAEVCFPGRAVTAVSIHLDAQSSQRHRVGQMRDVLAGIPAQGPAILGGDWNTSTYNSSRALFAIVGYCRRVLMGVNHVIRNHYLHPERYFERDLFRLLESHGFDYRSANRIGEHTGWYDMDPRSPANQSLREWVPAWCFPFIYWALREHNNRCPLKLDWLAAREVECHDPVIVHDVREGRERPLSDHDAVGVEIVAR
jgi:endonuclease/exonuclease/phosphatase family metal-dependent hydrolase